MRREVINHRPQTYQELFKSHYLLAISKEISPRMGEVYPELAAHLLKSMTQNGVEANYQAKIIRLIQKFTYTKIQDEGPMCCHMITPNQCCYKCYDCEFAHGQLSIAHYCKDCFDISRHKGHNFRIFRPSKIYVCNCGNQNLLKPSSFCDKHKNCKINQKNPSIQQEKFIQQTKFLLYIFCRMFEVKNQMTDEFKKKDIFGKCLITNIISFVYRSFTNKIIASKLLTCKFSQDKHKFPLTKDEFIGNKIFKLLIHKTKCKQTYEYICTMLIQLISVKIMRQEVLIMYFSLVHQETYKNMVDSSLDRSIDQYLLHGNQILQLLKKNKIRPLVPGKEGFSAFQRYKLLKRVFQCYKILQRTNFFRQIILETLSQIKITQLFYSAQGQNNTQKNQIIAASNVCSFDLIIQIIKISKNSGKNLFYLKKMIKECYQHITKTFFSVNLSIQKIFALAWLAYLDFNIDNIKNLKIQQILNIFEESSTIQLKQKLQKMVQKHFQLFRIQNFDDYQMTIMQNKKNYKLSKFSLQMYMKIVILLIQTLEQSKIDSKFVVFQKYIQHRQQSYLEIFQIYKRERYYLMEQHLANLLYETYLVIKQVLLSVQTSLNQVILAGKLGHFQQQKIKDFYQMLAYITPNGLSKRLFKKYCDQYFEDYQYTKSFIENSYSNLKKSFQDGQVIQNCFNLSFPSMTLIYPQSLQSFQKIFNLKMNSHKRSKLSNYVFKESTIQKMLNLFRFMFNCYVNQIMVNNHSSAQQQLGLSIQMMTWLFLQTKKLKIYDFLISFNDMSAQILNNILQASGNKFQIQKSFELIRKSIESNQIQTSIEERQQQKGAKKQKLKQRMKALKKSQSSILLKHAIQEKTDIDQSTQKNVCMICRDYSSDQIVYYMAHTRHSNVMTINSKISQEPLLVISTCSHTVHKKCLQNHLRLNTSISIFILKQTCPLCQQKFSTLFPVFTQKIMKDRPSEVQQGIIGLKQYQAKLQRDNLIEEKTGITKDIKSFMDKLFTTTARTIFEYGLSQTKYFIRKILPIIVELTKIQRFYFSQHAQDKSKAKPIFTQTQQLIFSEKLNSQRLLYSFIVKNLMLCVVGQYKSQEKIKLLNQVRSLKNYQKIEQQFAIVETVFQKINLNKTINLDKLKKNSSLSFSKMLKCPQDLLELNSQVGRCPKCKQITSKMVICLIDSFKCCENCKPQLEKHAKQHLGTAPFLQVEQGKAFVYCKNMNNPKYWSLYTNYVGQPFTGEFPQKGRYRFNAQEYDKLMQVVLDDMIEIQAPHRVQGANTAINRLGQLRERVDGLMVRFDQECVIQ